MTQPFILVPLHTYHKQNDLNKRHLDATSAQNAHEAIEKEEETNDNLLEKSEELLKEPTVENKTEPFVKEIREKTEPKVKPKAIETLKPKAKPKAIETLKPSKSLHELVKNASAYKRSKLKKIIATVDSHQEFCKFDNLIDLIKQSVGTRKKELPNEKEFYALMFKMQLGACITNSAKINQYFGMSHKGHWYKL